MRVQKLIIAASAILITCQTMAQTDQVVPPKYRKFAVYAGIGPSYFFNNVVTFKNAVNSFNYSFSARFMWEPRHSFLSLGFETGYYRLYTANGSRQSLEAHITNTAIPLQLVLSMKYSKHLYSDLSLGQSLLYNKVETTGYDGNFNAHSASLSDFAVTVGYRFISKPRISYAAETKFFYSSQNEDATIALLFIVGFKL
jgi:hypothetical protein